MSIVWLIEKWTTFAIFTAKVKKNRIFEMVSLLVVSYWLVSLLVVKTSYIVKNIDKLSKISLNMPCPISVLANKPLSSINSGYLWLFLQFSTILCTIYNIIVNSITTKYSCKLQISFTACFIAITSWRNVKFTKCIRYAASVARWSKWKWFTATTSWSRQYRR